MPRAPLFAARRAWAWRRLGPLLLLLALGALAYAPLRGHRFIQDDHPIVQRNPIVQRGELVEIFTTDYWAGVGGGDVSLYRPVTLYSFALDRGADGRVAPGRAHVTNVVLHALASLLLAFLARRLGAGTRAAFVAGLLFVVHPLHVAAVAPLTGRAEILALLFSLAALLSQTAAGAWSPQRRPTGRFACRAAAWGAGALLFLALGSKEVAFATPALMVALEWIYRRPRGPRAWLASAGALAPALLGLTAHLALRAVSIGALFRTQQPPLLDNRLGELAGLELWATRLSLAGRYLAQLVWPSRLSADYSGGVIEIERGLLGPLPLAGAVGLALLALLALWGLLAGASTGVRYVPAARLAGFSALLFLLPYLVVGNLFVNVGIIYAERLAYVPSAGFCLLVALAVEGMRRWLGRLRAPLVAARHVVLPAVALLLALAGWQTQRESRHWRDEETLFRAAIRATPASPRAHFTLGKILAEREEHDEALRHFDRTVELWPRFWSAWYERGVILLRRGNAHGAEEAFRRALELNPRHGEARFYLAVILRRTGRPTMAEIELRRTLRRYPSMTPALVELAELLVEAGRPAEAVPLYREAIRRGRSDLTEALRRSERAASRPRP